MVSHHRIVCRSADFPFMDITTSRPDVRDVLSTVLGGCYTMLHFVMICFLDHCIEKCYKTNEGRHAYMRH